ncbi:MAG: hypothetical protein A2908_03710 [Candidatus Staskawiczbacteria bacterium RIFCSPLOWO2_01_FULL_38_12b]|uniref:Uncharacterized protein n=1 Tax=Candidatus Staskawiczbacteria bacterium RIFCSPLOWO2_01_FULL_38_12b TaxID=1802214 RepID=A0A1G2IG22_9BACT|nr:MAG: hypothetical protein A2908_03710 [Candidatus Staskawiczbacteria bacterium RIFCSPLOWO2_01_FULL_38_12b]
MTNKNIIIIILAVGLLVVLGITVSYMINSPVPSENNISPTDNSATTEPESVQDISGQTSTAVTAISYANALVTYADRRIQIDTACRAYPSNITYKDNTGIMIDNRSPQTRTIKIGTTFTVKPWGFKIFVLPDIYLKSKTILVDCDQSQNVATILVQE